MAVRFAATMTTSRMGNLRCKGQVRLLACLRCEKLAGIVAGKPHGAKATKVGLWHQCLRDTGQAFVANGVAQCLALEAALQYFLGVHGGGNAGCLAQLVNEGSL